MMPIRPESDLRNKFTDIEKVVNGGEWFADMYLLRKDGCGFLKDCSIAVVIKKAVALMIFIRKGIQREIQIPKGAFCYVDMRYARHTPEGAFTCITVRTHM